MMKNLFFIAILFSTLNSCDNPSTVSEPRPETPKALQEDNSSYESISKRGSDDLVDGIYSELLSQNEVLKELESKIEVIYQSKSDSLESFDRFNGKNQSYFTSAHAKAEGISDSLLKEKMKSLITANQQSYNSSISHHISLSSIIEKKTLTIADLHRVLKIVKTLPVIEKYQKDNLPSTLPLKGFIIRQDKVINLADTLIN